MLLFRRSIGFRLFVVGLFVLTIPILCNLHILAQQRRSIAIKESQEALIESIALREQAISRCFTYDLSFLCFLEKFLITPSFLRNQQNEISSKIYETTLFGSTISILNYNKDKNSFNVIASGDKDLINIECSSIINDNKHLFDKGHIEYFNKYNPITQINKLVPNLIFIHKVYNPEQGELLGAIMASIDLELIIDKHLLKDHQWFDTELALILTRDDTSFIVSNNKLNGRSVNFQNQQDKNNLKINTVVIKKSNPPFVKFKIENQQQLGYISIIPGTSYSLLAYSEKKAISSYILSSYCYYYFYILLLIFGNFIIYLIIKRISKPMNSLEILMTSFVNQNFSNRYKSDIFGFEINFLGQTFNKTIEAILENQQLAEQKTIERELLGKEIQLSSLAQKRLLPISMPFYQNIELADVFIPAIDVGGDFYDVFVRQVNQQPELVLLIADTVGKGVGACCYSLILKNLMRVFLQEQENITEAMNNANSLFEKDAQKSFIFITAFVAMYNNVNRTLIYQSFGHLPALLRKKDGSIINLNTKGIATGVVESFNESYSSITLDIGDTLLLYTDGVTDSQNSNKELFGDIRLLNSFIKHGDKDCNSILKAIMDDINMHVKDQRQFDDITMTIMKVTG